MRRLLVTASIVPRSPILVTLMEEVLGSSETSALTRVTLRNIPEDTVLYKHILNTRFRQEDKNITFLAVQ
jgi:hypothetical protein